MERKKRKFMDFSQGQERIR